MPRFTDLLAVEGFDGADTGDIDLRTPDGGGDLAKAVGAWAKAFTGTGLIGIAANVGVLIADTDYAGYQLRSIPSLPPMHGSRLKLRVFATGDPGDLTINYTPVTEHDFGAAGDSLDIDGTALNGGPGTFERSNNAFGPDDGAIKVESGKAKAAAAAGTYAITGLSLTRNYAVRVTGAPLAGGSSGWVAWARMVHPQAGGSLDFRGHATALSNTAGSALNIQLQENANVGSVKGFDAEPETPLGADESASIEVASITCDGQGTRVVSKLNGVVPISDPAGVPLILETSALSPIGDVGVPGFTVGGNTGVTKVEVFEASFTECPSGGDEFVQFEVSVCEDFDNDQAYRLEGIYRFPTGGDCEVTVDLRAYHATGNSTRLTPQYGPVAWSPGIPIELQLDFEVSDADPEAPIRILHGYLNGVEVLTFDVLLDTPDQSGAFHLPHTAGACPDYAGTGNPGLGFYEDSIFFGTPRQAQLDEFAVLTPPTIPCEGPDPENPYPYPPPPDLPVAVPLRTVERGRWVESFIPRFPGIESSVGAYAKMRIPEGSRLWVCDPRTGRWLPLGPEDTGQAPPSDHPLPPYYDPCGILPPFEPGDTELDPLLGRYFGMSNMPVTILGPLFTGTQRPVGFWTPSELSVCEARASMLVGAQGGNAQYQVGGAWNKAQMIAQTIANLTPILSSLVAHTAAGRFIAYSMIDDLESRFIWPGMNLTELGEALADIRAACPGILYGVRRVPSKIPDLGFDFYSAQFAAWGGISAFDFGVLEYSTALARGAWLSLDLNFVHGGDGSSGIRFANGTRVGLSDHNWECSPAEVVSYITDMLAGALSVDGTCAKLIGVKGYMYRPEFVGRPGMVDALSVARNALAALPALP